MSPTGYEAGMYRDINRAADALERIARSLDQARAPEVISNQVDKLVQASDALVDEVRGALEGDSNDAEHDALASVAEYLQGALDQALAYAKERHAFGDRLGPGGRPMMDNEKRADFGIVAVRSAASVTNVWREELADTAIKDVLAYIAHACDRAGLDPQATFADGLKSYEGDFEDGPGAQKLFDGTERTFAEMLIWGE